MIKMIVASTENGLIGNKDYQLPWNIPDELKFFKQMTMGHTLLWGRKTFEHLPKKLLGRKHYVLTTAPYVENADQILHTEAETIKLLEDFKTSKDVLFICGGASIYEQFYDWANEIYWTEIKVKATGNVYLKLDLSYYQKTVFKKTSNFTVYLYKK